MPKVSLSFSGWIRNVDVTTAYDLKNEKEIEEIDVSSMSSEELVRKLKNGELFLGFVETYKKASDVETELFDYE